MQVFFWCGSGVSRDEKVYYQSFQLNGVNYNIGDSVYLFPENENHPHYIGRIVSAFVDENSGHADPHCIQVKWFERRVNLEESTRGIEESEREVFELEDVDINPIGCISGKNYVIKARAYDEAYQRMRSVTDADWYFCRGYFMQTSNAFQPYSAAELATRENVVVPEEDSVAQSQPQPTSSSRAAPSSAAKRKVTGRECVQCGATQTPQWREGPTGPKTLCNACGVRYGRAQAKAQKRSGTATAGSSGRQQAAAAAGASPAGKSKKGGKGQQRQLKQKQQKMKEEEEEDDDEEDDDDDEPAPIQHKSEQRPVRQAAQAALVRTAAYARTGAFPDEDDGLMPSVPQAQVRSGGSGRISVAGPLAQNASIKLEPAVEGGVKLQTPAGSGVKLESKAADMNLDRGQNGTAALAPRTELPIAALELASAGEPSQAVPTGLEGAAAAKLMALSSVALEQVSPRMLISSPKAAAQMLGLPGGILGSALKDVPAMLQAVGTAAQPALAAAPPAAAADSAAPTADPGGGGPGAAVQPAEVVEAVVTSAPQEEKKVKAAAPLGEGLPPQANTAPTTTAHGSHNSSSGSCAASGIQTLAVPLLAPLIPGALSAELAQGLLACAHQQGPPATATTRQQGFPAPAAQDAATSVEEEETQGGGCSTLRPPSVHTPPPAATPHQQLALDLPELQPYQPLFAGLDALGTLPVEVSSVLQLVRDKVDDAKRQATAAEEAVASATQEYTQLHQAAKQARLTATAAGQSLRGYLNSLMEAQDLPGVLDGLSKQQQQHHLHGSAAKVA